MTQMIQETKYNQPLILQRADPYVYLHEDGFYYFTASVPEYNRIILRRSETIEGLKEAEEVTIWEKHTTGPMSEHIWAPEIHYIEGKWYIYFAAGEKADVWKIRPYVLACYRENPMTASWVEEGRMKGKEGDDFAFSNFSLDATVLKHEGKNYFIWAQKVGSLSNLYIAEMATPTQLKTEAVLLTKPEYDWECVGFEVNEGPAILKKDDTIFLAYSASATGACYCMGLLKAKMSSDLLNPASWTKSPVPVVVTDAEKGIYGPGHNSFTKSKDGSQDIMIYHARQYEKIIGNSLYDPNRHTMVMPVGWDEEGQPVFQYQKQA